MKPARFLLDLLLAAPALTQTPAYKNLQLSIEMRVQDLRGVQRIRLAAGE
ncbi:MAG TPA: hypothetical protein PLG50_12065 [bacterium]|nr:hypothetical protein [bacterium]HQG46385.1 hypothetical protein [bacterium]HQI47539.1 hypothetical protein [bacterium]HQJ63115.1 hypothetical protein [bacterium]